MSACFAESPAAHDRRQTEYPLDPETADKSAATVFDPLTGELIEADDRGQLLAMHQRLEEVALEILVACRQIHQALHGDRTQTRPRLAIFIPPNERTVPFQASGGSARR